MMRETSLSGLAESLVAYGTRRGADQVEVAIRTGSNFSASIREGELETLVEAGFREVEVEVQILEPLEERHQADDEERIEKEDGPDLTAAMGSSLSSTAMRVT